MWKPVNIYKKKAILKPKKKAVGQKSKHLVIQLCKEITLQKNKQNKKRKKKGVWGEKNQWLFKFDNEKMVYISQTKNYVKKWQSVYTYCFNEMICFCCSFILMGNIYGGGEKKEE